MSGDVPHAVADCVVVSLRHSLPGPSWCASRRWYRWWFSWVTQCDLTLEESGSILGRLNGFGPPRDENTWASVTHNSESFWRARV